MKYAGLYEPEGESISSVEHIARACTACLYAHLQIMLQLMRTSFGMVQTMPPTMLACASQMKRCGCVRGGRRWFDRRRGGAYGVRMVKGHREAAERRGMVSKEGVAGIKRCRRNVIAEDHEDDRLAPSASRRMVLDGPATEE